MGTFGHPIDEPAPATLHGQTIYIPGHDGLLVLDGQARRSVAQIRPRNAPVQSSSSETSMNRPYPAKIAMVAGKPTALTAFAVNVPGRGTTPGYRAAELTAVDTQNNQVTISHDLPLPEWAAWKGLGLAPRVLGVHGSVAVVAVAPSSMTNASSSNGDGTVFGYDLATRQVRWQKDGFLGTALASGKVMGTERTPTELRTTALNAETGAPQWTLPSSTSKVSEAGPHLVSVTSYASYFSYQVQLVDASSGRVVATHPTSSSSVSCTYDEQSVTVCAGAGAENHAFAVDAHTGQLLWRLPDPAARRVAPRITAAWHGAVYGQTDSGSVVLDARTGADRATPAIAPRAVNEYFSIAADPSRSGLLMLNRATG